MTDAIGQFFGPKRSEQLTQDHNAHGMMCGGFTIHYVFCKDCAFLTRIKLYRFPMTYVILTYEFCINILYDFLKFYFFTKDKKIGDCVFKQLN